MTRGLGRQAAIFVGYLVVAIVATWPLPAHLSTAFTGDVSGDTGVYVWNTWVFQHEIEQGRLPFYTTSIMTGTPNAPPANLSLHNYTTFANVVAWPLQKAVGLVAAFNLVFLLNIALSGYALYLLARNLTGEDPESLIAGAAFALSPVLIARGVGHFSLVAAAPLPIFALLLRRVGTTGSVRHACALGAVAAWATFSDAYYGVFCLLMAAVTLAIQFVRVERGVDVPVIQMVGLRRMLDMVILSVAGFTAAIAMRGGGVFNVLGIHVSANTLYTPMMVLTLLVVARVALTTRPRLTLRREQDMLAAWRMVTAGALVMTAILSPVLYALGDHILHGGVDYAQPMWRSSPAGVDLLAFVLPSPNHVLWGPPMQALLDRWTERLDFYPEAVGSLSLVSLAVIAWAWWRGGWQPSRIRIGATLFYVLLSLGPFLHVAGFNTQIPLPWAVLRYVPVLGLVRSPGRFAVLVTMMVAILLAQALAHLGRQHPDRRRRWLAAASVLLGLELVPGPRTLYSAEIPALYQTIAADPRPDVRVLELPVGLRDGTSSLGNFNARTQYFQTLHGKAIVGGYLSRIAPKRRHDARRAPVLNALMTLSEGQPLPADQEVAARGRAEEFLRRTRLGYVIVDESRASPALADFAIDLLGLTLLTREGPLALYVPQLPVPADAAPVPR
jgi:hypothetical protein